MIVKPSFLKFHKLLLSQLHLDKSFWASPITSSLIISIPVASLIKSKVVIASSAVKHPALFGKSFTFYTVSLKVIK